MNASTEVACLLKSFGNMAEQSLVGLEMAKADGLKVVGIYCIFAPVEIIRAASALPVGLCGKRAEPIAAAEIELPANLCPLIKSSYGYAVTGTCPFFTATVQQTRCSIVGLSAFVTSARRQLSALIATIRGHGGDADLKVIVGGAAVNAAIAAEVGADGYARDCIAAVKLVRRLANQAGRGKRFIADYREEHRIGRISGV